MKACTGRHGACTRRDNRTAKRGGRWRTPPATPLKKKGGLFAKGDFCMRFSVSAGAAKRPVRRTACQHAKSIHQIARHNLRRGSNGRGLVLRCVAGRTAVDDRSSLRWRLRRHNLSSLRRSLRALPPFVSRALAPRETDARRALCSARSPASLRCARVGQSHTHIGSV